MFLVPMGKDIMEETTLTDLNQESSGSAAKNSFSVGLVARALGEDNLQGDDPSQNGDFFDCNLCLTAATEPVLTCCGHLFCWHCFYNLPYEFSNVKDCPVCGGDVSDTSLVPIYGNKDSRKRKSFSSGLEVPPRPRAKRVETQNQRRRYERGELMDVRIEQRIQELTAVAGRFAQRARAISPAINESASVQHREAVRFSRLVLHQRRDSELSPTPFPASLRRLEALDFSGLVEQRPSSLASSETFIENLEELRNADTNATRVRSLSGYQYFASQSLHRVPDLGFFLPEIDVLANSEMLVENPVEMSTRIGREEEPNPTPVSPLSGSQYFAAQSQRQMPDLGFILPGIDLSENSETLAENPEELSTRIGREQVLPSNGNTNPVDTVGPDRTAAATAGSSFRFSPRLSRWVQMPSYGSEFDAAPMSLASPTAPSSANNGRAPRER